MEEHITFNSMILKAGATFIGFCPELNISVEADSSESAKLALNESVKSFLKDAMKDRCFSTIMDEAGYIRHGEGWNPPAVIESTHDKLTI